jgi:hypothetical protein
MRLTNLNLANADKGENGGGDAELPFALDPPFALNPWEADLLRNAAGAKPDDYIALPVQVQQDPERPVEHRVRPAGPHGPAQELLMVPMVLVFPASHWRFSRLAGPKGASARSPIEGWLGAILGRFVVPKANLTIAGKRAVAAAMLAGERELVALREAGKECPHAASVAWSPEKGLVECSRCGVEFEAAETVSVTLRGPIIDRQPRAVLRAFIDAVRAALDGARPTGRTLEEEMVGLFAIFDDPMVKTAGGLAEEGSTGNVPPASAPTPPAAFHAHLDDCERCRERPFDLCETGAALLHAAGVAP